MSEYWVSHKKYFCKYCNIYIADDAPSRSHHENGLRHKGNVERFVRGLYKTGEKRKQDLEEEKREMVQVERAAEAAFARDVGSGLVKPGSSSSLPPPKPTVHTKPTRPSSNLYENYSTAASLGYTDPDAARLEVEAARRRTEGVAGDWEVVDTEDGVAVDRADGPVLAAGPHADLRGEAGQKRPLETLADEDDTRSFKLRRKKLGSGMGEVYDPGLIPLKIKAKKAEIEPTQDGPTADLSSASTSSNPKPTNASVLPKWSARGWKKPGVEEDNGTGPQPEVSNANTSISTDTVDGKRNASIKTEIADAPFEQAIVSDIAKALDVKVEEDPIKSEAKEDSGPPAYSGMFRKRRIRGGGAGTRGTTD